MSTTSGRVRGKKNVRNPQRSERRLLLAAVEVFSDCGPGAATVDAVCRKAGLNKRMVYHYFGNKAGLYRETLRYVYGQFLAVDIELASMLLPPEELLETVVSKYHDFLENHPEFVRMLGYENLNEGRVARQLKLAGGKSQILSALRLLLDKGRAEGRFRRDIDVDNLLISIFGLCFFSFSNRYTMSELLGRSITAKPLLQARKQHVTQLLLRGLSVAGPEGGPGKPQ